MDVPILAILELMWTDCERLIWTDCESLIWTDMGWPSIWVCFTRKGVISCGLRRYASCLGLTYISCAAKCLQERNRRATTGTLRIPIKYSEVIVYRRCSEKGGGDASAELTQIGKALNQGSQPSVNMASLDCLSSVLAVESSRAAHLNSPNSPASSEYRPRQQRNLI